MGNSIDFDDIKSMTVEERLELIDAIWDSIEDEGDAGLTEEVKSELDRRLAENDAHPENVVSWEEVKARLRNRQ